MKKITATILSITLVLSLYIFAVATNSPCISSEHIYISQNGKVATEIEQKDGNIIPVIEPGSILYFKIDNAKRAEDIVDYYPFRGLQEGYGYLDIASFDYLMLYNKDGSQAGYSYVVSIPVKDVTDTQIHKVSGYVSLNENVNTRLNFSFYVQMNAAYAEATQYYCDGESYLVDLTNVKNYACFSFENGITYTVDVSTQGKINLGFSTEEIKAIKNANPHSRIIYLDWLYKPVFNKEGILEITSGPDTILYKYENGELKNLSKYYKEDSFAYIVSTRRLSTLLLSNGILQSPHLSYKKISNPLTGCAF